MERMTLKEFISLYCSDIVAQGQPTLDLPDDMFTYDYILENDGEDKIKMVEAEDGTQIKVVDIISMMDIEFKATYTSEAAMTCYTNYLKSFIILNGEEILTYYRQNIIKELNRINSIKSFEGITALEGYV